MMPATTLLRPIVSYNKREALKCLKGLEYLSITIVRNDVDAAFGNTLAINEADSSDLSTLDGGKTWRVSTINIHSYVFDL